MAQGTMRYRPGRASTLSIAATDGLEHRGDVADLEVEHVVEDGRTADGAVIVCGERLSIAASRGPMGAGSGDRQGLAGGETMLVAEIRRKLGRALACSVCREASVTDSYFGFEDVLTSNVFGALRYLDPLYGLAPLLRDLGLGVTACPTIEFWRKVEGCEPDVIIDLGDVVVVVEAKLYAPFGLDQLPREALFIHRLADGRPWRLLCVTDHAREPSHHRFDVNRDPVPGDLTSLAEGVASYFERSNEIGLPLREIARRVIWMSWSHIAERLDAVRRTVSVPLPSRARLDDLLASLEARGLVRPPFHGFSRLPQRSPRWSVPPIWKVDADVAARALRTEFTWSLSEMTSTWRGWLGPASSSKRFFSLARSRLRPYSGWFSKEEFRDG
jgi:hypothetical protein